jgi:hypothetical protein
MKINCFLFVLFHTLAVQAAKGDFSFSSILSYTTNTYENDTSEHSESFDGDFYFRSDLGELSKFTFYAGFSNNFDEDGEDTINDSYLSISKLFKSEFVTGGGEVRVYLPFSDNSRNITQIYTKTTLKGTLGLKFIDAGITTFTLMYLPYFTQYFNRFETTTKGAPNLKRSVLHRFVLSNVWKEKLSLAVIYDYITSWNEFDNRQNDAYVLAQEASYAFNEHFAITLGHKNGRNLRGYDLQTQSIDIFDENTSIYYFRVNQNF